MHAGPVDLAHATGETVIAIVAEQGGVDVCRGMTGEPAVLAAGPAPGQLGQHVGALRGKRQPHPGIPVRVKIEPGQRLGPESFHRRLGNEQLPGLHPAADEPLVHDDVGIEDLAGEGIDPAGADGEAHAGVGPEHEVVAGVLGVLLHVGLGAGVLLVDLDGVEDAHLLKGLVPLEHALPHPAPIAHRRGVLEVEDDGLLGRAQLELGVGLLQLPPVDVPHPGRVRSGLADVAVRRREVAHASVRLSRLVASVLGQRADRVVKRANSPALKRQLEGQLDVLGERLGLGDRGQLGVGAAGVAAEELGRLPHQQSVHVDHRAAFRSLGDDGHVQDDAVGENPLPAHLRLAVAGGAHRNVGLDEGQALVVALPFRIGVAVLHARGPDAAGDGVGDEEALVLEAAGQLGQHLPVLLADPDGVEAGLAVGGGDDLLVVLGNVLELRQLVLLLFLVLGLGHLCGHFRGKLQLVAVARNIRGGQRQQQRHGPTGHGVGDCPSLHSNAPSLDQGFRFRPRSDQRQSIHCNRHRAGGRGPKPNRRPRDERTTSSGHCRVHFPSTWGAFSQPYPRPAGIETPAGFYWPDRPGQPVHGPGDPRPRRTCTRRRASRSTATMGGTVDIDHRSNRRPGPGAARGRGGPEADGCPFRQI